MEGKEITISDFTGGVVYDKDSAHLGPTEMVRCDNVIFTESNKPRKRKGFTETHPYPLDDGTYTINGGLGTFYCRSGRVYRVIVRSDGIYQRLENYEEKLFDLADWPEGSRQVQMVQLDDYEYITHGIAELRPLVMEPGVLSEAGCPRPIGRPIALDQNGAGDKNLDGKYRYRVSWLFLNPDGTYAESDPSDGSSTFGEWPYDREDWTTVAAGRITLYRPSVPGAPYYEEEKAPGETEGETCRKAIGWRVYRFKYGFSTEYEWVGDNTDMSDTFVDEVADNEEGDVADALRAESPSHHGVPPEATLLCCKHDERFFCAKNYDYPNRVWWSNQGEHQYFQAGAFFATEGGYRDIAPNDGDELMALLPSGGANLLVLKSDSAWHLREEFGGGYGAYVQGQGVGCVASNSVAMTPIGAVWLGKDGHVWAYDGATFTDIARGKVATKLAAMDPADARNCVGKLYKRHYLLAFHDTTITPKDSATGVEYIWHSDTVDRRRNNAILAYDIDRECWIMNYRYPRTDIPPSYTQALSVSAFFVGKPDDDNVCLFANEGDPRIYQWDDGTTDKGTSIEMVLQTADRDFGSLGWKRSGRVHVSAYPTGSESMSVSQCLDRATSFDTAVTVPLTASRGNLVEYQIGTMAKRFKTMALKAIYRGSQALVEFWGFAFILEVKGVR